MARTGALGEVEDMMQPALVIEDVTKRYGARRALDGLSFEVPRGTVCGFVGPNGAGKTTAFSVVSGFLAPDEGRVDVLGLGAFDPWRMKGRLGVLPQDAQLPERHTPMELLVHLGRLQGLSAADARADAASTLAMVRLEDRVSDPIASLSHGMRRRVAVASALVGSPELVLLDEPTAGLDPVQARSLRAVLTGLKGPSTVVISSHNLLELEQLCDWVVMIDKGRCVGQGSVGDLTGRGEQLIVELASVPSDLGALEGALPDHRVVLEGISLTVIAPVGADLDDTSLRVMAALVAQGVAPRGLRRGRSLEDRFVEEAAP